MPSNGANLAAALRNLLDQTYQMRGLFADEDGTIADAISDAEEALREYSEKKLA
jgi:hypothetical protein